MLHLQLSHNLLVVSLPIGLINAARGTFPYSLHTTDVLKPLQGHNDYLSFCSTINSCLQYQAVCVNCFRQERYSCPAARNIAGLSPLLTTDHPNALFQDCAMLGVVQVESWGMSLGFFFGFICIVVGERVAQEREQSI